MSIARLHCFVETAYFASVLQMENNETTFRGPSHDYSLRRVKCCPCKAGARIKSVSPSDYGSVGTRRFRNMHEVSELLEYIFDNDALPIHIGNQGSNLYVLGV